MTMMLIQDQLLNGFNLIKRGTENGVKRDMKVRRKQKNDTTSKGI